jgi:hypothetical protein
MPLQPVTCANFCRALSCCAGVRPNPMSGYFKIPEYLIPILLDKRGEVVKDADGKPKKDVRGLEKLIILFFEANRAHIIGRDEANLLTIPGNPCAISDGTREIRSNRGVFVLRAIRRIRLTSARSLSSRMSPQHPQSGGDFRRGAYHDLLDAGGNPETLTIWKGLPHNNFVASEIRKRRYATPGAYVNKTELAKALGRSQTWVGMVERGAITADASTIERALLEVDRIIARKKAIAKAKLEAAERLSRNFENLKKPDAGRSEEARQEENPQARVTRGKQNRHYDGPRCEMCNEPLNCDKDGSCSPCSACAGKADFDPDLIQILRDLSREPVNESAG